MFARPFAIPTDSIAEYPVFVADRACMQAARKGTKASWRHAVRKSFRRARLFLTEMLWGPELTAQQPFRLGSVTVDPGACSMAGPHGSVHLEPRVMDVAVYLARRPGEVITREELAEAIWQGYPGADSALTTSASKLRRALADCGGDPDYLQTVPKRGYRLVGPVVSAKTSTTSSRRARRMVAPALVIGLIAALALIGYTFFFAMSPQTPTGRSAERSIAVLAFEDLSPEGDQEWFARGLAEELLDALAKLDNLEVKARTSSFRFKTDDHGIRSIAEKLGVETILEGSVRKVGERVKVTAQLIDGGTGNHIWSSSYDRRLENVFEVQEAIARSVVSALQVELELRAEEPLVVHRTSDPVAHEYYLRARDLWKSRKADNLVRAIELYRQAVERDPGYAVAWAGLADAYFVLGTLYPSIMPKDQAYREARDAVERALEIAPSLGRAHTTLGSLMANDHNWRGARREMKRALELNPDYATGHQWYSLLLGALGRAEQGLTHARRALELDPFAFQINNNLRFFLYRTGQYKELIEHMQRMEELKIGYESTWYLWQGRALLELGRVERAIAKFEQALPLPQIDPSAPAALIAVGRARLGQLEEARAWIEKSEDILPSAEDKDYGRILLAEAFVALSNHDAAFAQIEKINLDELMLGYLRGRPTFEPIRSDARFARILERANLDDL